MKDLQIGLREATEDVTVLDLQGHLDGRTAHKVKRAVAGLTEQGRRKLVVNCTELEYLSSDGMGVFLQHLIRIRKSGGDIKFCHMRPELSSVLSVLGLSSLITVRPTESEAVGEYVAAEERAKQEQSPSEETQKLRVSREDLDDELTVAVLDGFIDRHTLEILDGVLLDALDDGHAKIVIDCGKLTYISSNGMGVFISYVNKARNLGGDIRFCNMRDIARTVITMLGLHRLFEIFDSRDEAIESFR